MGYSDKRYKGTFVGLRALRVLWLIGINKKRAKQERRGYPVLTIAALMVKPTAAPLWSRRGFGVD